MSRYRARCQELSLHGPVKGHPGIEVTEHRLKTTLLKLGLLKFKQSAQKDVAVAEANNLATLLVTHGACSNILYQLLTGAPPAQMATVGSFYLLRKNPESTQWVDVANDGIAMTSHLVDRGNDAH